MQMTVFQMKAKMGSCAFCHAKFHVDLVDRKNSEDIMYDNVARRAFHLTCPPEIMPQPNTTRENTSGDIQFKAGIENKNIEVQRQDLTNVKTKTDVIESQVLPEILNLFDAKFAIPCELEGEKTHLSIRVATRKNGKFVGSRVIQAHFGRHDGRQFIPVAYIPKDGNKMFYYRSFLNETEMPENKKEVVRQAIKMLLEGTENAAYALEYARVCRRCWHCNLPLINVRTLEQLNEHKGMGPVCWNKYPELRDRVPDAALYTKPTSIIYR